MNNERRQKVIDLYKSGLAGPAIAKELGIHMGTVYYYLKDVDKPLGGRHVKVNGALVEKMYLQDKMSCQQIADALGLTDSGTVWNRLKNRGVKFRTKSEGMDLVGIVKVGDDSEILQLYSQGLNQCQIAEKYGVNQKSIYNVLKRNNVAKRPYTGPYNHAWKGGVTSLTKQVRGDSKYDALRDQIFLENNFTCQISNTRGGNLEAHHIVEFEFIMRKFRASKIENFRDFAPFYYKHNLILVSEANHEKIHGNKESLDFAAKNADLLSVARIDYQAASLFIERFHYSGHAPKGTSCWYGLFIKQALIGVVGIGRGNNKSLSTGMGIPTLELVRLAIVDWAPKNSGSYFLSRVIKLFKEDRPDIRCLVSFADPNVGHSGGVYRASNWQFVGQIAEDYQYKMPDGRLVHKSKFRCKDGKTERERADAANATKVSLMGKYKFVYRLED